MAHRSSIVWIRAVAAWLLLGIYTYFVAPSGMLPFLVLYALLFVALVLTFVPLSRIVARKLERATRMTPGRHVRRAVVLAGLVEINLALAAAHAWNPFVLALCMLVVGIEEMVAAAHG
ncbi:MAG TPA: hypothetical protein VF818_09705 [Ktedonobacterales bacterium]